MLDGGMVEELENNLKSKDLIPYNGIYVMLEFVMFVTQLPCDLEV